MQCGSFAYGLNLSLAHSLFWDWYHVFNHVLSAPQAYVAMIFVTALAVMATVLVQGTIRMSFFSNRHILQEMSKLGHPIEAGGGGGGAVAGNGDGDGDDDNSSNGGDGIDINPIEAFESGRDERATSTVTMRCSRRREEVSAAQPVNP